MPEPIQDAFPFWCDRKKLGEFLTRVLAIEEEHDRLRGELLELKEEYADFIPMRAVLAAIKIARTAHKTIHHPKEPTARETLERLVTEIGEYIEILRAQKEAAVALLEAGVEVSHG